MKHYPKVLVVLALLAAIATGYARHNAGRMVDHKESDSLRIQFALDAAKLK